MRAMAGLAGVPMDGGWGTPAGGGNVISRKSPPVWISAPAAAAAAARSAVGAGGGAETGFEAGCAEERGRRARVWAVAVAVGPEAVTACAPAAGAGCRAAEAGSGRTATGA